MAGRKPVAMPADLRIPRQGNGFSMGTNIGLGEQAKAERGHIVPVDNSLEQLSEQLNSEVNANIARSDAEQLQKLAKELKIRTDMEQEAIKRGNVGPTRYDHALEILRGWIGR